MLLMFNAIASKNETDLVNPVASLMNTGAFELDKKPFVIKSRNHVFIPSRQNRIWLPAILVELATDAHIVKFCCQLDE